MLRPPADITGAVEQCVRRDRSNASCLLRRRLNLQVDTNVPEDRSASTLSPEPRHLCRRQTRL